MVSSYVTLGFFSSCTVPSWRADWIELGIYMAQRLKNHPISHPSNPCHPGTVPPSCTERMIRDASVRDTAHLCSDHNHCKRKDLGNQDNNNSEEEEEWSLILGGGEPSLFPASNQPKLRNNAQNNVMKKEQTSTVDKSLPSSTVDPPRDTVQSSSSQTRSDQGKRSIVTNSSDKLATQTSSSSDTIMSKHPTVEEFLWAIRWIAQILITLLVVIPWVLGSMRSSWLVPYSWLHHPPRAAPSFFVEYSRTELRQNPEARRAAQHMFVAASQAYQTLITATPDELQAHVAEWHRPPRPCDTWFLLPTLLRVVVWTCTALLVGRTMVYWYSCCSKTAVTNQPLDVPPKETNNKNDSRSTNVTKKDRDPNKTSANASILPKHCNNNNNNNNNNSCSALQPAGEAHNDDKNDSPSTNVTKDTDQTTSADASILPKHCNSNNSALHPAGEARNLISNQDSFRSEHTSKEETKGQPPPHTISLDNSSHSRILGISSSYWSYFQQHTHSILIFIWNTVVYWNAQTTKVKEHWMYHNGRFTPCLMVLSVLLSHLLVPWIDSLWILDPCRHTTDHPNPFVALHMEDPTTDLHLVKQAYRKLSLLYHPDFYSE